MGALTLWDHACSLTSIIKWTPQRSGWLSADCICCLSMTTRPVACDSVRVGICHLEAAFKAEAAQEVTDSVDEAVARWYYGTEPLSTRKPVQLDNDPVDPVIPSIERSRKPGICEGASSRRHVWLTLEFSDAGRNVRSPSDAAM